jgi:hypothetical protein
MPRFAKGRITEDAEMPAASRSSPSINPRFSSRPTTISPIAAGYRSGGKSTHRPGDDQYHGDIEDSNAISASPSLCSMKSSRLPSRGRRMNLDLSEGIRLSRTARAA